MNGPLFWTISVHTVGKSETENKYYSKKKSTSVAVSVVTGHCLNWKGIQNQNEGIYQTSVTQGRGKQSTTINITAQGKQLPYISV